jgi:hypothetical protein
MNQNKKYAIINLFFIIVPVQVFSETCFTQQQIHTSASLFTYKGNVYDASNYNHPGGKSKLRLTIGNSLENFVNLPKYDFHLTRNKFTSDLTKMLKGILCEQPTSSFSEPTTNTIQITNLTSSHSEIDKNTTEFKLSAENIIIIVVVTFLLELIMIVSIVSFKRIFENRQSSKPQLPT